MPRSSCGNVTVTARQLVNLKGIPMLLVASEASWLAQTNHGIYGTRYFAKILPPTNRKLQY
jgi:hypothetical protein